MLDSQRAIATHGVVGTVGASSSGSGDTKVQTVDVPRIATNAVELGGELRSFIGAGAEFVTCRSREIIGSPRTDAIRRHVAWAVLMEFPNIGATVEGLVSGQTVLQLSASELSAVMSRAKRTPAHLLEELNKKLDTEFAGGYDGPSRAIIDGVIRDSGTTICDSWG